MPRIREISPAEERRVVAALAAEEPIRSISDRMKISVPRISAIAHANGLGGNRRSQHADPCDPKLSPPVTKALLLIARAAKPLRRYDHHWAADLENWSINSQTKHQLTSAGYLTAGVSNVELTPAGRAAAERLEAQRAQATERGAA